MSIIFVLNLLFIDS